MKRRTVLIGCGVTVTASVAGCLSMAGLDEYSASPAAVDPDVLDETGYEEVGVEPLEITEEFEVQDHTEEVVVTNYVTEHEKTIGVAGLGDVEAAVFYVFTSPEVGVAGVNLNPIEEMSSAELVELVKQNYDEIENVEEESEEAITVLDEAVVSTRFEGEAEFDGVTVDVYIRVTEAVQTDRDDFLTTIAVYPVEAEQEDENAIQLAEGVVASRDE